MTQTKILHQRMLCPFTDDDLECRPGSLTKDGDKGMPLFYVTTRAMEKRLRDVLGIGQFIFPKPEIQMQAQSTSHTYVAVTAGIIATHPDFKGEWWNVGEDVTATGKDENLITVAYSQAIKRAASAMGIGQYLYFLKNVGWFPVEYKKFKEKPQPPAAKIEAALEAVGFNSLCEITGEKVDWKTASVSMDRFGKILSKEGYQKIKEQGL